MNKKTIYSIILPISVVAIIAIMAYCEFLIIKQTKCKIKTVYRVQKIRCIEKPKNIISVITIQDLKNDLKTTNLSDANQELLISSIQQAAKQYNIPVLVLYSLIYSESSFRFWIKHSLSKIRVKGRVIQTRAIGLGGIIYKLWGDKLKNAKIIQTKSDLFQIKPNIMATAYILDYLRKEPLKKGTKNNLISAMRRYYGGNVKAYTYRIKQKMSELLYKKEF